MAELHIEVSPVLAAKILRDLGKHQLAEYVLFRQAMDVQTRRANMKLAAAEETPTTA